MEKKLSKGMLMAALICGSVVPVFLGVGKCLCCGSGRWSVKFLYTGSDGCNGAAC